MEVRASIARNGQLLFVYGATWNVWRNYVPFLIRDDTERLICPRTITHITINLDNPRIRMADYDLLPTYLVRRYPG